MAAGDETARDAGRAASQKLGLAGRASAGRYILVESLQRLEHTITRAILIGSSPGARTSRAGEWRLPRSHSKQAISALTSA